MKNKSVLDRLTPDPAAELLTLTGLLGTSRWPAFPAEMDRHFDVARSRPKTFSNHAPVLGLSIGGTNTKVMLGSIRSGRLVVEHAVALRNPPAPVQWEEFFHALLFDDAVFRSYLSSEHRGSIGVSFPMAVIDGVPFHRTKVPTIVDLVARERDGRFDEFRFDRRFLEFLRKRGVGARSLFYQGDGIVAHHGALSVADIDPTGRSTLLICGTGLATGDERNYVQIGIAEILAEDEELYPRAETEDRQYHYAVAGKGLFGLMRRALNARSCEPGSLLRGRDFSAIFPSAEESRLVVEVGAYNSLPASEQSALRDRFALTSGPAWEEVVSVGEAIVNRVGESIANSLLATIISMGPAVDGTGHVAFLEGSIARNAHVLRITRTAVAQRLADRALWERCVYPKPRDPVFLLELPAAEPAPGVGPETASEVDLTLVGTVTAAAANDLTLH